MDTVSRRIASLLFVLACGLALPGGEPAAQAGDPTTTQVVAGYRHTCALTSDGAVKCWGWNRYGQLGNSENLGTNNANPAPLDVPGLDGGVVAIAAGDYHTCALTGNGAVECWGNNYYGQLGNSENLGTSNANPAPLEVQGLDGGVVAIAAGDYHTCALTGDGAVKCWGWNNYGQLGNPANSDPNPAPLDVQGLDGGVVAIAAGDYHTCALTGDGAVECWGWNVSGQLGNPENSGTNNANPAPLDVPGLDGGAVAIAAGYGHTCALTGDGAVECWGWNNYGQLGNPANSDPNPVPLDVPGLDGGVVAIAAGYRHTCALTGDGAVKCWGLNDYGQLGNSENSGNTNANPAPLDVPGLDGGVVAIAAGESHTCVLTGDGALECWGLNDCGQLGNPANSGNTNANPAPLDVQGLSTILPAGQSIAFDPPATMPRGASLTLTATATSGEPVVFDTWTPGTCALDGDTLTALAGALCGVRASQPGSASYAAAPQQLRLIRIGDPTTTQVVGGYYHTCALTSDGAVKCWGWNFFGQLGNPANSGTNNANPAPLDVQGLDGGVVAIAAGYYHTCALTGDGAVKCWGWNRYGQLGNSENSGTTNANPVPLDVQGLDGGVVAIAAGESHTCALTGDGAVKCWGWNNYGQLGNPANSDPNPAPLDVPGLDGGVVAIAAGDYHTCALTGDGAVKCWGLNFFGQLGNPENSGTSTPNPAPLDAQGLDDGVVAIAAGGYHTCALTGDGAVKCWGLNNYGQLGNPANSDPNPAPLDVPGLDGGVVAIAAGYYHTCALTGDGAVKCWGWNRYGQLGNSENSGTTNANPVPLDVPGLDGGVVAIATGYRHTCALTGDGAVECWGWNYYGQLGNPANSGTTNANPAPLDVQGLSIILPAGQSIAFDPPATMPRGASLALTATATSGEPVVFDTWTPGTCALDGDTLTALAGALCGVRASQPGSASYAAAPQQLRLIRIVRGDTLTLGVSGQGSVDVAPDPAAGGIDACTQADSPCTAIYGDADESDLVLTATPAIGWHLDQWSGDCVADPDEAAQATLTLDADKTCAASFAINTYTVTFADWNGTVLATVPVEHGSAATAPADPVREGYTFTGWDVAFGNITGDLTVTAQYTINTYTVTASVSGGHGAIAPLSVTVEHGGVASFTVTPDPGYHAVEPFGGDCAAGSLAGSTYTTGAVEAGCGVVASFAQNAPASVSASSGGGQSATVYQSFAAPLVVRVADAAGVPLEGVAVSFASPVSGASADLAAARAVFAASTDADGLAFVSATANAIAGSYEVVATVEGVAAPASFALTNEAVIPTLTLTVDPPNVAYGAPVTLTLVVEGANPAGTVDFVLGNGFVLCAAVPLVDGVATCVFDGLLPLGEHTVTAIYHGDAGHAEAQAVATLGARPPITVPAMSPWALAVLAVLLGLVGFAAAPRRRG